MHKQLFLNRSFFLYLIGQTVSSLGDGFYLVGFMWLAMQLSGGKGIVLGGIFSIFTICEIVFGFIAGPVADRFNKKRILIIVDIIRGLVIAILFVLVKFNAITILHLYVITLIFSAVSPFFHRTEFAIIPQLVEKEMLLKANGFLGGSKKLMQVIAPSLGGILIGFFGVAVCFLLDAISFFVSVLCIIPVVLKSTTERTVINEKKNIFAEIKQGFWILRCSSFLLTLAIYALCINFFAGPLFPLLPLVSERIGFGPSGYGLMMSLISAGLITSSFLIGFVQKFLSTIKMLLAGLIISAIAISILGWAPLSGLIIFAAFILGIAMNLSNLPIITLFQKNIPQDKIGVVSSFVFTFAQVAMPISMILSGYLVDTFSLSTIFLSIGVVVFLSAIVGFALPQFRQPELQIETQFEH